MRPTIVRVACTRCGEAVCVCPHPAVFLAPAVHAQTVRDAERRAIAGGLDIAAFRARQERAQRRDRPDVDEDVQVAPRPVYDRKGVRLNVTPERMGQQIADERAGIARAFDVTIGAHVYVITAPDRNEAAKAARKHHADAGHAPDLVRVRNHEGSTE